MSKKLEDIQRSFTRMIDGLGLLTYRERLDRLKLTTLLERRMRGDLIEMFKIVNHHVNYGSGLFNNLSGRLNVAARVQNSKPTKNKTDFFAQRVILFWNRLPYSVKSNCPNVDSFKSKLDSFRDKGYVAGVQGQFWELSYEIFDRVEVSDSHRKQYRDYMTEHPFVARRRKVNIR